MKNSKFIIDKLSKVFEQGLISSKDLTSELLNILKSKRDEFVFKMKLISKDEFDKLFGKEAKRKGFNITGKQIIGLLSGTIRPFMVDFLKDLKGKYKLGCITNNVQSDDQSKQDYSKEASEAMALFDHVIESSLVGLRKPDPRIYYMSCEALGVDPKDCIYLDDLGINLKPARAIGMTTIKVIDPNIAVGQVKEFLGII